MEPIQRCADANETEGLFPDSVNKQNAMRVTSTVTAGLFSHRSRLPTQGTGRKLQIDRNPLHVAGLGDSTRRRNKSRDCRACPKQPDTQQQHSAVHHAPPEIHSKLMDNYSNQRSIFCILARIRLSGLGLGEPREVLSPLADISPLLTKPMPRGARLLG